MANGKSKILVIGGTGYIGKYIVQASARLGHPTFALVRESTASSPDKSKLIESFKSLGVVVLYGDMHDHESLVEAIKQADVVISTVSFIADQVKIIAAIKEAGNVKRFLPSEFGVDPDHVHAVEPGARLFELKGMIRKAIIDEGIPYTFVSSNAFAGFMLPGLGQSLMEIHGMEGSESGLIASPPRDKVVLLGDGNAKVTVVYEEDVATYTIKAVDDPRTLNKTLFIWPPANVMSFNEIVGLWEKKIGKTLDKSYISEDQLLERLQAKPAPINALGMSLAYSMNIKGDSANFEIEDSIGVEASKLYPQVKYTTIDDYLDRFV